MIQFVAAHIIITKCLVNKTITYKPRQNKKNAAKHNEKAFRLGLFNLDIAVIKYASLT